MSGGIRWTRDQLDAYIDRVARPLLTMHFEREGAPPKAAEIKRPRMNKLESAYAAEVLGPCLANGQVTWFDFEPFRMRLAEGAWFTPDFGVITGMGRLEFHETKGFWREAARVRIKVAARLYPFRFVACQRERGGIWKYEEFTR